MLVMPLKAAAAIAAVHTIGKHSCRLALKEGNRRLVAASPGVLVRDDLKLSALKMDTGSRPHRN